MYLNEIEVKKAERMACKWGYSLCMDTCMTRL